MHDLEGVPVDQLSRMTREDFEEKFKKLGSQLRGSIVNCSICRPVWDDDSEGSDADEEGEGSSSHDQVCVQFRVLYPGYGLNASHLQ